jgi:hypothetical protein
MPWDVLCEYVPGAEGIPEGAQRVADRIRSALYRAAAEGEAWRAIEEWLDADDERYQTSGRTYEVGYYHSLLRIDDGRLHAAFGSTRLEALQAAAEWVKAQALLAPPKGSTP